jgi:hypothetical protein
MQRYIFIKIIFSLLLIFFLIEYLNPSAIGVRADFSPPLSNAPSQNNQASQNSGGSSFTTHSMIQSEVYWPWEIFPIAYFFSSVQSFKEQTKPKKIYHPPASTLLRLSSTVF